MPRTPARCYVIRRADGAALDIGDGEATVHVVSGPDDWEIADELDPDRAAAWEILACVSVAVRPAASPGPGG